MSPPTPDDLVDAGSTSHAAVSGPVQALISHLGTGDGDGPRQLGADDVFAADREGLLGPVDAARTAGAIVCDDAATAVLDTLVASTARQAAILESRAAAAVSLLAEIGIETRALKGLAVSHLDHATPEARQFGDIDLLVRGPDIRRAVTCFAEVGFARHFPEPYDHFDERIGKGVAVGDDHGVVIDLHRTLALGYYGTRFALPLLWADPAEFVVGGVPMAALGRPMRFLHCALHLALTPAPTMISALDLAVIAGDGNLDTESIVGPARDAGCRAPLARAVEMTTAWLGAGWAPDGLETWASELRPSLTDRIALAAFDGRWASSTARSATALLGLRGADRRLAVAGMLRQRRGGADG